MAVLLTAGEGDNTVLLQQVSAALLKEFRGQFKGSGLNKYRGMLEFLGAT